MSRGALCALVAVLAAVAGGLVLPEFSARYLSPTASPPADWPPEFALREIRSSFDGTLQNAYHRSAAPGAKRPLVVSLHVWAGNFASPDPLAEHAIAENWHYMRPDFRGPNKRPVNCLSEQVLADIDDAIAYAIDAGGVDPGNIFVTGFSGGGYAALGAYLRTHHPVKAWLAWAPISDLEAWYWETVVRGHPALGRQVLSCTGSGERIDSARAAQRSPLSWPLPVRPTGRLEIYAGISDGHTGTVPISHSINFYNRLVAAYGSVDQSISPSEASALLTRALPPGDDRIAGRAVYLHRDAGFASLTVFDGSHLMLPTHAAARIRVLASMP